MKKKRLINVEKQKNIYAFTEEQLKTLRENLKKEYT